MAFDLPSLPSEIVSHIFSYLSLDDRKNVKLTCHLYYRCAIVPSIIKREKLVFRDADNFESKKIAQFLIGLNFSQLNLQFDDLLINRIPAHTWEICGPKINSLNFHFAKYDWDFDTLLKIIESSVNLAELEVRMYSHRDGTVRGSVIGMTIRPLYCPDDAATFHMIRWLDKLAARKFERRNLHTLVWVVNRGFLVKNKDLENLFLVFPCIKHFTYDVLCQPETSSSSWNLDHCLNPSLPLEGIVFNVLTDGGWIEKSIIKPEWVSRLTNFETHCQVPYYNYGSGILFEFFKFQKNLTTIKLNIKSTSLNKEYTKNLTFRILESCSCLKDLQLKFKDEMEIPLNQEELSRFLVLISKLRCLTLNKIAFRSPSSPEDVLPTLPFKDFALNKLVLDHVGGIDEKLCSIIFQCCPRLNYLKLFVEDNGRLQMIFLHLIDLKTLILCVPIESAFVYDYGFCGDETRGYSIKRLQKLEHLMIMGYESDASNSSDKQLTARIIHELHFPRLKTLELDFRLFSKKILGSDLIRLTSNVPGVNKFGIIGVQCLNDGIEFCSHFKHLSQLYMGITWEEAKWCGFGVKRLTKKFPRLRKLRFIIYEDRSFHINQFTKRVSCQKRRVFAREIIDGYEGISRFKSIL